MLLPIFQTSVLIVIQAGIINGKQIEREGEKGCAGLIVDDVCHEVEILVADIIDPRQLALDYERNTLFFSYNALYFGFQTSYLTLNTKEIMYIADINEGFTHAVDQKTHIVYIGGDALYAYDQTTNLTNVIEKFEFGVGPVYFKQVLYISLRYCLHTLIDGGIAAVEHFENTLVNNFVLDNDDVFFYTNYTGFYKQKKGTKDAVLYFDYGLHPEGLVAMGVNGKVYTTSQDGIFRVENDTLKKIADLKNVAGLTFDQDNNIIYSDQSTIYRLKPMKKQTSTSKTHSLSTTLVLSPPHLFLLYCCILKLFLNTFN